MSFYEKCVLPAPKKASFVANDRKRVAKLDFGESNKKSKSFQQFNLKKLTGNSHDFTRTNDEVHHTIDICPVMKAFMDTEQFQRLRNIKQLGASYLVYSSADHNRYQHSIGVAYLAREMCSRIRNKQRSLGATDKDILCVTLAGLLHDIGHGPFSHIYEVFRAHVNSEKMRDPMLKTEYDAKNFPHVKDGWSHEESSLLMIDAALASLGLQIDTENLDRPLKQIGDGLDALTMRVFKCDGSTDDSDDENVLTSRDFIFVKECIFGKAIPGFTKLIGRQEPEKEWLYDIVANRHNGLDVDKVDYFARVRC
jgi:HD superfamily phosphohydrolase